MSALRSLQIALGMDDRVTGRLRGIDSQIDGIESGALATQKGFGALEKATQDYGHTARLEIDGVGRDISELDRQIDENADITEKAADRSEKSWTKVGAAIGAAALATEAFVRTQQDHYVTAEGVAYITGMSQREVVGLAGNLIDLSTTQEDAFGLLHAGARQGLQDADDLAAYTQFWSNIGTASRENSVALAEAGVSLRAVGIEAQDLTDHYDTFGFVMSKTTGSVSEFLRLTGYMARDMDSYGMEISDVAVLLAALEEKGMGAADSKRALRTAMSSAKGETRALYRELGVTENQLSRLNEEVLGGADYVTRMGEAFDESRSPLQQLQVWATRLATSLGFDLNPLLGDVSVVLSGLSTALVAAAGAKYILATATTTSLLPSLTAATTAAWGFAAALLANPITWIIVGVVALGVALYALYTRWDDISGWFMDRWDSVSRIVTGAMDRVHDAWDNTIGALIAGAEWLVDHMGILALLFPVMAPIGAMHLLRDNWDDVVSAMSAGWDTLVNAAQEGAAWMADVIGSGLEYVTDLFYKYHPLGILINQWDEITEYLGSIDLFETGRDILLGLVEGILDVRSHLIDIVMGIGKDILDSITGFFGISSPSKLMEEMGGYVGEGFAQGVEGSMPASLEWAIDPQITATTPYSVATTTPGTPGEIVYQSTVVEPTVHDLTGEITYRSLMSDISLPSLTGQAMYRASVSEPHIEDQVASIIYASRVTEPVAAGDFTDVVTYCNILTEPTVDDLTAQIVYQSTVVEPTVHDLAGEVQYVSQLDDPVTSLLTESIVYQPTVPDLVAPDLTGTIYYHAVGEDLYVDTIYADVLYRAEADEQPAISDHAAYIIYSTWFSEPMFSDVDREVRYQSVIQEVDVPDTYGIAHYRGVLTDTPLTQDITGTYEDIPSQIDDMRLSWVPETDPMNQLRDYTPERDADHVSSETNYGDIVFSPTINVESQGGDAREIATAVDRRLRQTFDRHANVYFGRQRRRRLD